MADQVPSIYETPAGLRQLANYLRSPYGVKSRSAIEHEKRVDYFKGTSLLLITYQFMSYHFDIF